MKSILAIVLLTFSFFLMDVAEAANFGDQVNIINIHPIASISTSADSTAVDMNAYDGKCAAFIEAKSASADPTSTLNIKLKESATSGGSYTDVSGGGFTQITSADATQSILFNKNATMRYLKLSRTFVGPSAYYLSGKIICQKRIRN